MGLASGDGPGPVGSVVVARGEAHPHPGREPDGAGHQHEGAGVLGAEPPPLTEERCGGVDGTPVVGRRVVLALAEIVLERLQLGDVTGGAAGDPLRLLAHLRAEALGEGARSLDLVAAGDLFTR